jgi:hypothetical protein
MDLADEYVLYVCTRVLVSKSAGEKKRKRRTSLQPTNQPPSFSRTSKKTKQIVPRPRKKKTDSINYPLVISLTPST